MRTPQHVHHALTQCVLGWCHMLSAWHDASRVCESLCVCSIAVLSLPRSDSRSGTPPTFHRTDSARSTVIPIHVARDSITTPTHHARHIHVDVDDVMTAQIRHDSSFVVRKYVHDKLRHQMRAVCYAFLASYLANWYVRAQDDFM